jgi:hypothetical protein
VKSRQKQWVDLCLSLGENFAGEASRKGGYFEDREENGSMDYSKWEILVRAILNLRVVAARE